MEAKIRKIGNSLGLILPKDVLDILGLKDGDNVKVNAKNKSVTLVLEKSKR